MPTTQQKPNRESLLKVRVRTETKQRVMAAANILDLDQSTLVRLALNEYIAHHCPHAA